MPIRALVVFVANLAYALLISELHVLHYANGALFIHVLARQRLESVRRRNMPLACTETVGASGVLSALCVLSSAPDVLN